MVVIDPGHGGYDPGTEAAGAPLLEKDLALQIALRLQGAAASSRGVDAQYSLGRMTTFVTLAERTAFANKAIAPTCSSRFISTRVPTPRPPESRPTI